MKKKTKILFIVSIFTLFSVNILAMGIPQHTIALSNQDENSVKSLMDPKLSAEGDVTSLWNYTFTGLGGTDPQVAISGDGSYVIAINATNATLFHRSSSTPKWLFSVPQDLEDLAISDDGKYIVICDRRQVFLLNNTPSSSKKEMWKYPTTRPGSDQWFNVDISSDGQYIVVGNRTALNEGIQLFDNIYSSSKQPLWSIIEGGTRDIAISGNGEYIVNGNDVSQVRIFNATNPSDIKLSYATINVVNNVAISFDGEYVVCGNSNDEAYLFNTTNNGGKYMWKFTAPGNMQKALDISSDGKYIGIGDHIKFYYFNNSIQGGNKIPEWSYTPTDFEDSMPYDCALSATGKYMVVGTWWTSFYLFNNDITTPKTQLWKDPVKRVKSVDISLLGNYLVGISTTEKKLFLYHHDVPIPTGLIPGAADDDDDDDEPAIPYGNYYLGFAAIAIVALIVITKRKALLKYKK